VSYNICIIMGNVTREIELRYTPRGTACADFGLAVNKVWFTESGEKKESVSFFDVAAWDKGAEWAAKHLVKGSAVLVEGELKQDTWEDKQTGEKRSKVKITARKLTPCFATWKDTGRQPKDEEAQRTDAPGRRPAALERPPADPDLDPVVEDDIPF
jgi:single-strand DNA-binding protein